MIHHPCSSNNRQLPRPLSTHTISLRMASRTLPHTPLYIASIPTHPPVKPVTRFPPPACCHTHKSPRVGHASPNTILYPRATRTPPPAPHSWLHPIFWDPLRSCPGSFPYLLPPGSPACVRSRSCSEARSRQRPARGWLRPRRLPIPAGPTRKAGTVRGVYGARRLLGLRALTCRGRLHSGSAGDCRRPRPGLARRSSARPGGARCREGGWLTAGGGVGKVCAEC